MLAHPTTLGLVFLATAGTLGHLAHTFHPWGALLWWPALSCAIAGIAYLRRDERLFGKRLDGTLHPLAYWVLLPFRAVLWVVWRLQCALSREPPYNRVNDRWFYGRRLSRKPHAPPWKSVVDLTSEFAQSPTMRDPNTLALPILDGTALFPLARLREVAARAQALPKPTLIHCAQGHGRSGMVTAAALILDNPSLSVDEAVETIQQARPKTVLKPLQYLALVHCFGAHQESQSPLRQMPQT